MTRGKYERVRVTRLDGTDGISSAREAVWLQWPELSATEPPAFGLGVLADGSRVYLVRDAQGTVTARELSAATYGRMRVRFLEGLATGLWKRGPA